MEKVERVAGRPQGKEANHQGVVGFLSMVEYYSLDDVIHYAHEHEQDPLLLILDGVTDPHNLGACLRTADAAGVDAIVIPKDRAATVDGVVRKVAAGAAEFVPVVSVTNLARTLDALKAVSYTHLDVYKRQSAAGASRA